MFILLPSLFPLCNTGKGIMSKDPNWWKHFHAFVFQQRLRTFSFLILNLHTLYQEHFSLHILNLISRLSEEEKKYPLGGDGLDGFCERQKNYPHELVDGLKQWKGQILL